MSGDSISVQAAPRTLDESSYVSVASLLATAVQSACLLRQRALISTHRRERCPRYRLHQPTHPSACASSLKVQAHCPQQVQRTTHKTAQRQERLPCRSGATESETTTRDVGSSVKACILATQATIHTSFASESSTLVSAARRVASGMQFTLTVGIALPSER